MFIIKKALVFFIFIVIFFIGAHITAHQSEAHVQGTIFYDTNRNGVQDNGESGVPNITVKLDSQDGQYSYTDTTNGGGQYNEPATWWPETYNVKITIPSGYVATTPNPTSVYLPSATGVDASFGIAPALTPTPTTPPVPCTTASNSISGKLFVDTNKDGYYNGSDTLYNGQNQVITLTGCSKTITLQVTNGSYNSGLIPYGSYTVSYNGPPTGSYMSYPTTGVPPSFNVVIGPSCSETSNDGSCSNGNIINLNFGITNVTTWFQSVCGDVRQGSGITNMIPAAPSCGGYSGAYMIQKDPNICPTNGGIAFTGNTNANFGQGQAAAAPNNWIVGGNASPETYNHATLQTIHTSYTHMITQARQSGITPINLSTVCTLNNCTLPGNLPHGVYQANGNVNLQSFTAPPNQNYVFLINGDVTFLGNVTLPVGSTILFSTSGDMYVDKSVGVAATSTTSNLDGFYSSDKSFIINSTNSCATDQRLNISGSVIVDAGLNGGTFQNNRDLCTGNASCPTVSFTQRPDLLVNAPAFVKNSYHIWQEILPGTIIASAPTPTTISTTPTKALTQTPTPTSVPAQLVLSNLSVNDPANPSGWSFQSNLQVGNNQYSDKTYTYGSIPTSLLGAQYIQPYFASRTYTNDPLFSFSVNQPVKVYVSFDPRAPLPSWLTDGSWTDTGTQITNSEPKPFEIYVKNFGSGTVTLGHNSSQTSGVDMYTVIVLPQGIQSTPTVTPSPIPTVTPTPTSAPVQLVLSNMNVNDPANPGGWSFQQNLQVGNLQYSDKTYTYGTIPSSLIGTQYIQPYFASRAYTSDPLFSFTVNQPVTTYVSFDPRAALPGWLSDGTWANSGLQITNSEPKPFNLYQKNFPAGTITLGHNSSQTTGVDMYTVIVVPQSAQLTTTPTPTGITGNPVKDTASTAQTGSSSTITWNHTTTTQANRLLVVTIAFDAINTSASQVTYNGVKLTKLTNRSCPNTCSDEIWYLVNPQSGTYAINVSNPSGSDVVAGSSTYYNVDQTTPFGTATSGSATSTSASVSTTTTAGQIVVDAMAAAGIGGPYTQQSSQTQLYEDNSIHAGGSSIKTATGTTTSMTWSINSGGGGDDWALIAVPIR